MAKSRVILETKYIKYFIRASIKSGILTQIRGVVKRNTPHFITKIHNHVDFFQHEYEGIKSIITEQLKSCKACKVNISLLVLLRKPYQEQGDEPGFIQIKNYFNSNMHSVVHESAIDDTVGKISGEINAQVERFIWNGSNWSVASVLLVDISFGAYRLAATRGHGGPQLKSPIRGAFNVSGVPPDHCFEGAFLALYYRSYLPPGAKKVPSSKR